MNVLLISEVGRGEVLVGRREGGEIMGREKGLNGDEWKKLWSPSNSS